MEKEICEGTQPPSASLSGLKSERRKQNSEHEASAPPQSPAMAPSPPQMPLRPPSLTSSLGSPEAAEHTSPQGRPTSPPQALVALSPPQPPPELQQELVSSRQSEPELIALFVLQDCIPPTSPIQTPPLESSPQPAPEPQQHSASTPQTAAGATEDLCVPPEAYQVPALYTYFSIKGTSNFPLRLSALNQASTIVLSNSHHQKYVCIAGWVILGGLDARNARDLPAYRQAYDQLAAFAVSTRGWVPRLSLGSSQGFFLLL
ncbi:hypothetical protein SRHO_G00163690 [Serrasalmus rhombeus]